MWSLLGLIHFHPRYGEDHVGSIIDHHAPIGLIRDGANCFCQDGHEDHGAELAIVMCKGEFNLIRYEIEFIIVGFAPKGVRPFADRPSRSGKIIKSTTQKPDRY